MSINYSSRISTSGLILAVDAANPASLDTSKIVRNLLSNANFSSAGWQPTGATVLSGITDPNGGSTAFRVTEDTSNGTHSISGPLSFNFITNNTYCISFYAKAAELTTIQVQTFPLVFGTGAITEWDLLTGTVGVFNTTGTATITNAGNGWYRCSMYSTATATISNTAFAIYGIFQGGNGWTGTGTKGFLVWGPQIAYGTTPTTYSPNTSSSIVPIWNDLTNSSRQMLGQSTSFISYGTFINAVSYDNRTRGSLVFDNNTSYVAFPELPSQTNSPLSVFAWVYLNATPTVTNGIWGHYSASSNNIHFEMNPTTTRIRLGETNKADLPALAVGTWKYVGFTSDGNNHAYYIDGVLNTTWSGPTGTILGSNGAVPSSHMIGRSDAGRVWNGRISHLVVHSAQLTAIEVANNFNALRGRYGI